MQLQHVNVKLFVDGQPEPDLEPLIPVFHRWIQGQVLGELLLDVADYRHVHAGPGVVLIGHQGNYSVDQTGGRTGIRYNRKAALDGSNLDRLQQACRAALTACQRLEAEPNLAGKFRFNGQEMDVFFNDRLLVPNRKSTREAALPDVRAFFGKLFGGADYSLSDALSSGGDPRELFAVSVKAARSFPVEALLTNLDC